MLSTQFVAAVFQTARFSSCKCRVLDPVNCRDVLWHHLSCKRFRAWSPRTRNAKTATKPTSAYLWSMLEIGCLSQACTSHLEGVGQARS
jgi:hypothetical protein